MNDVVAASAGVVVLTGIAAGVRVATILRLLRRKSRVAETTTGTAYRNQKILSHLANENAADSGNISCCWLTSTWKPWVFRSVIVFRRVGAETLWCCYEDERWEGKEAVEGRVCHVVPPPWTADPALVLPPSAHSGISGPRFSIHRVCTQRATIALVVHRIRVGT